MEKKTHSIVNASSSGISRLRFGEDREPNISAVLEHCGMRIRNSGGVTLMIILRHRIHVNFQHIVLESDARK